MKAGHALACLLLAACSGHVAKPLVVTTADNGKQISLASGGEFLLHLTACHRLWLAVATGTA